MTTDPVRVEQTTKRLRLVLRHKSGICEIGQEVNPDHVKQQVEHAGRVLVFVKMTNRYVLYREM